MIHKSHKIACILFLLLIGVSLPIKGEELKSPLLETNTLVLFQITAYSSKNLKQNDWCHFTVESNESQKTSKCMSTQDGCIYPDPINSEIHILNNNTKYVFSAVKRGYVQDEVLSATEITGNDICQRLKSCMQKYPNEPEKWIVQFTSTSSNVKIAWSLKFAGVPATYLIHQIDIPAGSDFRGGASLKMKNGAPRLRITVLENGEKCNTDCEYAELETRSWSAEFRNIEKNQIQVRLGVNNTYTIWIRDGKQFLADAVNLEDSVFDSGLTIKQDEYSPKPDMTLTFKKIHK